MNIVKWKKTFFAFRAAKNFHYLAVSRKNRKSLTFSRARFLRTKLQFISLINLAEFSLSMKPLFRCHSTTDV